MTSKTASMYGTTDHWAPGFPVANARPSDRQFLFQSNFEQTNSNDHDFCNKSTAEPFIHDFKTQSSRNAPLGVSTAGLYSSPAMFTASNTQIEPYGSATISPIDTSFDVDHASPGSDTKISFDSQMRHTAPSNYETFINDTDSLSSKRRCDSLQSNFEPHLVSTPQVQVGRRRGSEYAEPGSARAIYLEKNRKAASKCRNKQKRQQEELVETARDVERRNKILKAEVELLKSGMRDLMELVGQHTDCPDARLKLYLQREADRLAIGGQRNALPSPLSGSSYSGPGSVDKVSSPEDE
ncbi:hypothetical protein BU25DRAFT_426129 [Macroventuria anomochaeta]|uniref:Uncharacterized protein n=1 Tax=Macroventuria anomochaeta TaxID=301207 RepID=A0ACB6RL82_9PLEO|nr:uncharacterized protein BU25DRAFT_426129 [Macroventuria anomochaeta]KAF2621863.1 hypothetical protein BU25DRAFT_426129 [Macroventuria anomochaeta]